MPSTTWHFTEIQKAEVRKAGIIGPALGGTKSGSFEIEILAAGPTRSYVGRDLRASIAYVSKGKRGARCRSFMFIQGESIAMN